MLKTLTPREEKVLKMRFGIDVASEHTLEEVGKDFSVTRERIRQIEVKALRKFRHPSRSKKLHTFFDKELQELEDGEDGYEEILAETDETRIILSNMNFINYIRIVKLYMEPCSMQSVSSPAIFFVIALTARALFSFLETSITALRLFKLKELAASTNKYGAFFSSTGKNASSCVDYHFDCEQPCRSDCCIIRYSNY